MGNVQEVLNSDGYAVKGDVKQQGNTDSLKDDGEVLKAIEISARVTSKH